MDPQKDPFDSRGLEALKAVNKILLQLSLYEPSHPSVQSILKESGELIDRTLAASPRGTVVFAKDHDRRLANGRIIGSAREAGGTGLGLSIAKALVELQGGRLRVESDEGKGAAFFFTLPIYAPPAEAPVAAPPKRPWWKVFLGLK